MRKVKIKAGVINYWSTKVRAKDFGATGGLLTEGNYSQEHLDYIGAVWDKNRTEIEGKYTRREFQLNVYDNARAAGMTVKQRLNQMQRTQEFTSPEQMGNYLAESVLRKAGDWKTVRGKIGRGTPEFEAVGARKDRTYRVSAGNAGRDVYVRFNAGYREGQGDLYDIGYEDELGNIRWGDDNAPELEEDYEDGDLEY